MHVRCPSQTEAPGYGLMPLFMLLSHSVSLSLSLSGATPVFSPLPHNYSFLLLSYPVRHLPFLCTLSISHGCAFITPHVWVSRLFYMKTFPTCHMCVLPASCACASCPGYAYLSLMGFPTLLLSSSCTPVILMVLTPCKRFSLFCASA